MYSTDLFDADTIERMAEHWHTLLEGIASDPAQRIADLPILSKKEQHRLLVEWNDTRTTYPALQAVHRLFETQVARAPEAIALIYEDHALTYHELNRRANQLAHRLRALGVTSTSVVGICMDRSLELIVSMLSILKAGGAYLPLDPSYPADRLAYELQDTRAAVLITQKHYLNLNLFAATPSHIISLDANWQAIEHEPQENLPGETDGESLAYIMYTSGSTGWSSARTTPAWMAPARGCTWRLFLSTLQRWRSGVPCCMARAVCFTLNVFPRLKYQKTDSQTRCHNSLAHSLTL